MHTNRKASSLYLLQLCIAFAALMMLAIFPLPLQADNDGVPIELQVKLLLTALTYDKNLQEKPEQHLKIGVLYFPSTDRSQQEATEFFNTLNGFKDKKVSGLTFDTSILSYVDITTLKKGIADNKITMLYLASGDTKTISDIITLTRTEKILSCTSNAEYVTTYGVTMAVGLKDNKPKIYFNLSSAQLEGAEFSAKFLRITEIVGKE